MRALVIYGSRWGGTVAVAEKICETLKSQGLAVDVVNAKKPPSVLAPYDLFIVGSGMRADKWTKETMAFLEKNASLLRTKKTALFVSCQMAERQGEAREEAKNSYLVTVAELYGLRPISFGFFGGYLDFSKSHGLFVDILVRVNRKSLRKNGLDTRKVHDTRDWKHIESWAVELAKVASAS